MPSWMGKIHPKYTTPHAALIVQFVVSAVLVVINFAGGVHVQEAFQRLLALAGVLQLVPFLYMFAALVKFGLRGQLQGGRYGRGTLMFAGFAGLLTTSLAIIVAYFPAKQITSLWKYEVTMFGITIGFIALAFFFFYVYGRRKIRVAQIATSVSAFPAEHSSVR